MELFQSSRSLRTAPLAASASVSTSGISILAVLADRDEKALSDGEEED